MGARQFDRSKTFWWNEVNWEDKTDEIFIVIYSYTNWDIIQNYFSQTLFDSAIFIQIISKVHS